MVTTSAKQTALHSFHVRFANCVTQFPTAENLAKREGDLVVVLQDGSVETSGYTRTVDYFETDERDTHDRLRISIDCGDRQTLEKKSVSDLEV